MDRAPAEAEAAALAAIEAMSPSVELRRLRMRQAGGRQFADVVIGVPPGAAVGQGHAAADAVEAAVERALPNADVVVHVEPIEDATLRERAHAAAVARAARPGGAQPRAGRRRRAHGALAAREAARRPVARRGARRSRSSSRRAICAAVPEIAGVQTHLEPLAEASEARGGRCGREALVRRIVREATGARAARASLPAHGRRPGRLPDARPRRHEPPRRGARRGRARSRSASVASVPDIADVIVHTEP